MTTHEGSWQARDVVRIHGADAAAYLHGQVTQNMQDLAVGNAAWSFLLQPTGKVVGWFRITRRAADDFVIDTEPSAGAPIVERLARFRMRMKVEFTLTVGRCAPCDGLAINPPDDAMMTQRSWPVSGGYDLLCLNECADTALVDVNNWERIAAGVPRAGRDFPLDDSMIPAEFGAGILNASVDFNKGCYTGQELVHRMHARGNNAPRPLRVLVFPAMTSLDAGVAVLWDGTEVGTVTSIARGPDDAARAFARLSRRVEIGADVVAETGESAQVHELPQTGYDQHP